MNDKTIVKAVKNFKTARSVIGALALLTAVNVLMYVLGTGKYFLFTATIPYLLAVLGIEFGGIGLLICSVLAIATWIVYVLGWFGSRNKRGWLTASLIFVLIDTIATVFVPIGNQFIDILVHVVVAIIIAMGMAGAKKLAKAGLAFVKPGTEAAAPAVEAAPAAEAVAAAPVAAAAAAAVAPAAAEAAEVVEEAAVEAAPEAAEVVEEAAVEVAPEAAEVVEEAAVEAAPEAAEAVVEAAVEAAPEAAEAVVEEAVEAAPEAAEVVEEAVEAAEEVAEEVDEEAAEAAAAAAAVAAAVEAEDAE